MKVKNEYRKWAILWVSGDSMGGQNCYLMGEPEAGMTILFRTRRQARAYRDKRWGYIRGREELRVAPHFWRLPRVVRCEVTIIAEA